MRKADTAVEALRRRAHGEDVDVPGVPTRVLGQELLQPWARGGCVGLSGTREVRARDPVDARDGLPGPQADQSGGAAGGSAEAGVERHRHCEPGRRGRGGDAGGVRPDDSAGVSSPRTGGAGGGGGEGRGGGYGRGVGVAPYTPPPLRALSPAASRRYILQARQRVHVRTDGMYEVEDYDKPA
eukprot:1307917-Pleurochrysis_carterae.AAC.1